MGEFKSHSSWGDVFNDRVNGLRGQTDASTVLKTNETVGIGNGDSTGAKPGAGSARRVEDGHRNWSNVLSRQWARGHAKHSQQHGMTADMKEYISTCRDTAK